MHKKYLNLSDNFWLSEYIKFLSPRSEILVFDEKNLEKIDIESHLRMWGEHEFTYRDDDLNNHMTLVGQFYTHLNKINNKYQDLIKDFLYTDMKTPKKNQNLGSVLTQPSWIFLGGKEERQVFEQVLNDYYSTNLDNPLLNELDKKEQFYLNPVKLLKYQELLNDIPELESVHSKRSKTMYLSLGQKIPYFRKDYSIVKDFNSFIFWTVQVGMFFEVSGSITNSEEGIIQKIKFSRLTIF
jgi:hypothetical protein